MEESEKRRERLRAMRMEAEKLQQLEEEKTQLNSPLPHLGNPLIESMNEQAAAPHPRFGFYTDPMAAFSKTGATHIPNFETGHPSYTPNPSHHGGDPSFTTPNTSHHGGDPSYTIPHPCFVYTPRPLPVFRTPNPMHQARPGFSLLHSGSPGTPFPSQGIPRFRPPPPQTRDPHFSNSPSHGLGYGRGRGRGDGSWMSPRGRGSVRGRGRGRAHDFNSQPHSYYDKSMVEDPWESLTPVLWQSVFNTHMTPRAKKHRVSHTSNHPNHSNSSLADFLAAAIDEAVGSDA